MAAAAAAVGMDKRDPRFLTDIIKYDAGMDMGTGHCAQAQDKPWESFRDPLYLDAAAAAFR